MKKLKNKATLRFLVQGQEQSTHVTLPDTRCQRFGDYVSVNGRKFLCVKRGKTPKTQFWVEV